MIALPRAKTEPTDNSDELRQRVKALRAQLSAEAESYRLIISAMATTCRALQARICTLETERLQNAVEGDQPGMQGFHMSRLGGRSRRCNSRSLSWPSTCREADFFRKDAQGQADYGSGVAVETQITHASIAPVSADHWPRRVCLDVIIFEKACQAWF